MWGNFSRRWMAFLVTTFAISVAPAFGQVTGPDLAIGRTGVTTANAGGYTPVLLYVNNHGNAPATVVNFTYTPATAIPSILPGSTYVVSADVVAHGHSGRGGGITYTTVGYFINQSTPVTLAPGTGMSVKFYVKYPVGVTSESWTVNAGTATQLNLVSHVVTASVTGILPPIPSAPTGVTAAVAPTTDGIKVSWHAPSVGGTAISQSTITATPISGASTVVLTGTVTGPGTSVTLTGAEPKTTYSITVTCKDLAGTGPASVPITLTTPASTHVPGAPVITYVWWISNSVACSWDAPTVTGDSPIDDYEVDVTDTDGGNVLNDAGLVTEAVTAPVNSTADSVSLKVRAHNAAGWGAWSAVSTIGGL